MFKNKELNYIATALVIGGIIYHSWLTFSPFAFGDWAITFSQTIREYLQTSAWGIHGGPLLWKYPLQVVFGILGSIGLDFNIVEKLTILWPIIVVAPISSFLLIKRITNSNIASLIGSFIFSYNTYFLSIDTQGHELLTIAYAVAPFAILAFIHLLEKKKLIFTPLTVLALFIVGAYDLRSLYITSGVIGLYALYHQLVIEKKPAVNLFQNLRNTFLVFLTLGLLNLYWLLPVISMNSLTSNEFLIRQLFGGEFYSLQSALTLFYPFWTGSEPTWFQVQRIPFYFWLFPILSFLGLVFSKNKKAAFFGILALIGVFLTKQEAYPFSSFYSWLYTNVPGFAAFREASKFYFLTAISYSVLIGCFVVYIENKFENRRAKVLVLLFLTIFALLTTKPLLTGEIKTMFVKKTVPKDFAVLKDYIIKDKEYSKVFGVNLNQYYNFTTYNHPTLNALYSLRNYWGGEIVSYDFLDDSKTEAEKLTSYLLSGEGRRLLSSSSVGYVPFFIEDKQTNQNIRRDLGKGRSYFEQVNKEISYLKPIDLEMENIILYKNTLSKPHIYLTKEEESLNKDISYARVEYQFINQAEYKVKIKDLRSPMYLNFTDLFHPDWKIRIGEFKWYEVLIDKGYFLEDKFHSQNVSRSNAFLLDPKHINQKDIELTIYFRPQSYLYLGLILSTFALSIVLLSIFYFWRNKK